MFKRIIRVLKQIGYVASFFADGLLFMAPAAIYAAWDASGLLTLPFRSPRSYWRGLSRIMGLPR